MGHMDKHARSGSGDRELQQAARAGILTVIGWFFANLLGGMSSPTGMALVFLLWLGTLLAGATCVLALWIGLWRRTH